MKIRALCAAAVWVASSVSGAAGTLVQNLNDVSYWVGSGQNQAVLIIDWQDNKVPPGEGTGQNLALAWGYRWPMGQTRTGQQMLIEIAAADPRLVIDLMTLGGVAVTFGIGYDLDGDGGTFTFDQFSEDGFASDPADHFAEGFEENGFWGYKTGQSTNARPPFTQPGDGSGFMYGSHEVVLTNGSWNAWVFSTQVNPPYDIPEVSAALAVVPEPSTAMILGIGAIGLFSRKRRTG